MDPEDCRAWGVVAMVAMVVVVVWNVFPLPLDWLLSGGVRQA